MVRLGERCAPNYDGQIHSLMVGGMRDAGCWMLHNRRIALYCMAWLAGRSSFCRAVCPVSHTPPTPPTPPKRTKKKKKKGSKWSGEANSPPATNRQARLPHPAHQTHISTCFRRATPQHDRRQGLRMLSIAGRHREHHRHHRHQGPASP